MRVIKNKSYNHLELNEVKQHLRINVDYKDDDNYLKLLIKAATRIAEDYICDDIALTTTTIEDYEINDYRYKIDCPKLNEITGISGDTVAITNYQLYYFSNYCIVEFKNASGSSCVKNIKNLVINYSSGYDKLTIEPNIKIALLVKISELYDVDRSNYVSNSLKYTRTFESNLDPYKIYN